MAGQKAVLLNEVGKPVVLGSRPVPTPAAEQVKVKVTSTMILPHDSYSRASGLFVGTKLPWVLGANVAGEVVELGSGVGKFKLGDHVFGLEDLAAPIPEGGGLQEYALLDEAAVAKVPSGFTDDQAVSLPVNAVTSFMALFTKFGFSLPAPWTEDGKKHDFASENIVIIAAGSNVGKLGVQFAKIAGVGKVICVAGLNNTDELKGFGATHVIDRHGSNDEVAAQIHEIVGKDGVTHVFDCYSWTFELALNILSATKPAHLAVLHPLSEGFVAELKTSRPLTVATFVPASNPGLAPYTADFWDHLTQALQAGKIAPVPFQTIEGLDVEKINQALDVYLSAKPQKQVIVHP